MTERPDSYFAPDGSPLDLESWSALFRKRHKTEDDSWWRRQTVVGDAKVSTVWLGLNHAVFGPPLFWETMIFGGPHDEEQWRWSSQEAAFAGHERIVASLRAGKDPEE